MGAYNGRDFWDALVAMTPAAQMFHSATVVTSPYEGDPLDLTLFVYAFNHEADIVATLDKLDDAMKAVNRICEIVVIDDSSKDGTVENIRQYIAEYPERPILLRANRRHKGLAQCYIDAAFIGRGKYFRLVYGDNAEPMETQAELFKAIGDADIIIPYYVTTGGQLPEQLVFTKVYRTLLNFLTRQRINNYDGEPLHLRYNVMRWHPDTHGAGFHADLLGRLLMLGFTFKQLPCRTVIRRHGGRQGSGENNIAWGDALSMSCAVVKLFLWRMSSWLHQRS